MPHAGPADVVAWIGGFNLTHDAALTEITHSEVAETTEVAVLGPDGQFRQQRPTGRRAYSVEQKGYLTDETTALRRVKKHSLVGPNRISVIGHFGDDIGAECRVATELRMTKEHIQPQRDDLTMIELGWTQSKDGAVYDGRFIHPGHRRSAPHSPPYTQQQFDLGARPSGTSRLVLMADNFHWRGRTGFDLHVRHSNSETTTSQSAWASALSLNVNPKGHFTGPNQAWGTLDTLRRYLAISWSWSGSAAFAIDNTGGYQTGDTELHLDGRSATEFLFPGDIIRIGSSNYTVESGGTPEGIADGTADFDITISPGLTAAAANNAAVSTINTDASARLLAAVVIP